MKFNKKILGNFEKKIFSLNHFFPNVEVVLLCKLVELLLLCDPGETVFLSGEEREFLLSLGGSKSESVALKEKTNFLIFSQRIFTYYQHKCFHNPCQEH